MATLPSNDVDTVWQELMSEFSNVRREIPVTKNQFRGFLVNIDSILEGAEVDIVQSVPAGPIRTWLMNNPVIGRSMVIRIMEKRREAL